MIRARAFRDESVGVNGSIVLLVLDGDERRGPEHAVADSGDGTLKIVSFKNWERPPAIALSATEAQKLVDQLWDAGARPSAAMGSAGQLAAVEKHLNDVRGWFQKLLDRAIEEGRR